MLCLKPEDRGQQEPALEQTLPAYDPKCYLCPGNARAQGDQNPAYDNTFVFVNDYSAVKEQQDEYKPEVAQDGKIGMASCPRLPYSLEDEGADEGAAHWGMVAQTLPRFSCVPRPSRAGATS